MWDEGFPSLSIRFSAFLALTNTNIVPSRAKELIISFILLRLTDKICSILDSIENQSWGGVPFEHFVPIFIFDETFVSLKI